MTGSGRVGDWVGDWVDHRVRDRIGDRFDNLDHRVCDRVRRLHDGLGRLLARLGDELRLDAAAHRHLALRTGAFFRIGRASGEQEGDEGRPKKEEQTVEEPQGRRSREPPAGCRLRVNTRPP